MSFILTIIIVQNFQAMTYEPTYVCSSPTVEMMKETNNDEIVESNIYLPPPPLITEQVEVIEVACDREIGDKH